jgi:hypothetical protein
MNANDWLGIGAEWRLALADPNLTRCAEGDVSAAAEGAAYRAAVALGRSRLFGVALGDWDGVLAVPLARAAARRLTECLRRLRKRADDLGTFWDKAEDDSEAREECLNLLEGRMEVWATFVALDEAQLDALAHSLPGHAELVAACRQAQLELAPADEALLRQKDILSVAAGTELLANWRRLLVEPYSLSLPWWLDGTLEEAAEWLWKGLPTQWSIQQHPRDGLQAACPEQPPLLVPTSSERRTSMDTLFGHLAMRFSKKPENLATEGLYFVLDRSGEARRLFLRFLGQSGVTLSQDLSFKTQAGGEDGSIPDLVARDAAQEVAIIEAKFWAGLTERQPNRYFDRLPASSGLLVFIAPAMRFESLWRELLCRCKEGGREIEGEECYGADWRVARIAGGRRLALTSWRATLQVLYAGLQQAGEAASASDVLQLQGLADRMDAEAFLPLTSEELTSTLGTRIMQFCKLVDDAVERLAAEQLAQPFGNPRRGPDHYYGRSFRLHEIGCCLYFAPWYWSRHGGPIWLHFQNTPAVHDALRPLGQETPPRLVVNEWGVYVPIALPICVDRDAVLAAMQRQICCVAERVKDVPPAGESPPPFPEVE